MGLSREMAGLGRWELLTLTCLCRIDVAGNDAHSCELEWCGREPALGSW